MGLFDEIAAEVQKDVAVPKGRGNGPYLKGFGSKQKPVEIAAKPIEPPPSIKAPEIPLPPEMLEPVPNDARANLNRGAAPGEETPRKGWPYSHDTRLLETIRWVIETYWEGKDPREAPTKEMIVEKLMQLKGLSRREALAVDQVTRHDTLKSPGR